MLVPVLARLGISIIPINYTIWYEYFLGTLPELNEILDKVRDGKLRYTPDLARDLYYRFFVSSNEEMLERVGLEARALFSDMVGKFDAAGDELATFQSQLESAGAVLGAQPQREPVLGDRIRQIMQTNEQMRVQLEYSVEEMNRLKAELEETRRRASCDPLTGIANRKIFMERLESVLEAHTTEADDNDSVLMIDIDHFKQFNDDYGHLVGDKVIKFVASALTDSVKGKDLVARYGGEEFCVLLEDTSTRDASIVAEQIRKKIESSKISRKDSGEELRPVTVSIGVAGAVHWDTAESWLEKADRALYQSKEAGRNRVTVSTEH